MDDSFDTREIVESIIKEKAMKRNLGNQVDTVNDKEFFDLIDLVDDNSEIQPPRNSLARID